VQTAAWWCMSVCCVRQGESSGGMERTIDQDKVAAAQDILNATRASKLRCAVGLLPAAKLDPHRPIVCDVLHDPCL
jgi:hypothetical protein